MKLVARQFSHKNTNADRITYFMMIRNHEFNKCSYKEENLVRISTACSLDEGFSMMVLSIVTIVSAPMIKSGGPS